MVGADSGSKFARATEYEFRHLRLPRTTSRRAARQLLSEHAEYGRWELARLRRYPDGSRKIVLRRKILRVQRAV
ncbi:hypothetical protein EF847_13055 [Actinobacteria bacterium YIM 96077]|uniref:Uncharacterized protein n=2 Tax=Phytoactinopolyspora halophila TaxID=1981511 RepID=A0A329QEZ7_9ACTN|nr:hypothetical protein EF847_13055 [Actinobacteria bacterium YIM 96077]RAW10874.1 hypothetical protein DPM12_18435 [Phytoactinopolyspora halophila]